MHFVQERPWFVNPETIPTTHARHASFQDWPPASTRQLSSVLPFHLFGIETSRAPLTVTHGSVRKKNTWADISYIFPYTVFIVENITLCMSSIFPFQLLSLLALCPVNPYPYGFFPKRWLCHPLLPLCIWEGVWEPGWGMAMAYLDIGWGVPFSHFPPLLLLSFLYAVQIYEI